MEQAVEEERRLGFEKGIRRGKGLGFDEGRNLAYGEGEQGDEEDELTPPGTPPPPVLPPKDPAPRVRSRRMSVASSRAKVPIVSDPVPSSMPMTPLHASQTFRYPQIIGSLLRLDHPASSICCLPTSWHALALLPRIPLRSAPSNKHRPVSVRVTSHLRFLFLPGQPRSTHKGRIIQRYRERRLRSRIWTLYHPHKPSTIKARGT